MNENWDCPFCGRHTTITDERYSEDAHRISRKNKYGDVALRSMAIACPNKECGELHLVAELAPYKTYPNMRTVFGERLERWVLRPQGVSKVFPDYIPAPILQDYREACLIRDLSPKASATLSRRCLQGMIRDFWGIAKPKLIQEIEALKDKVDPSTWAAIDAVRKIGNIGAHMEKDIDVIVDVDPDEAAQLIGLVETLIEDWYIARHERELRMSKLVKVAAAKEAAKNVPPSPSVAPGDAAPAVPPTPTAQKIVATSPISSPADGKS